MARGSDSVAQCWRRSSFPDPFAPRWPLILEVEGLIAQQVEAHGKAGDPLLISLSDLVTSKGCDSLSRPHQVLEVEGAL